ncbi:MAG: phosphonate C-P lyase system protein PhnG [Gammaproteobacteria bacterium]|jgi:alpha-D-ribose 1-methylphosphonate 5-triphosphate synthase subunit PhnG
MINRTEWVRALTALPAEQLLSITTSLSSDWKVCPKAVPQSGLGILKLNDSAFAEAFYLGEFPMSTAWLEIQTPDGQIAEGAAQVMDDRAGLAEALALSDAVLSARLPGWERLEELLNKGVSIRTATSRERKKILAHTRVNFSLLDDVGDDDA